MTPHAGRLHGRRVLFVHQSADLYGSDRVLLECAAAVAQAGGTAVVALPSEGPLVPALQERGVETHVVGDEHLLRLERSRLSAVGVAGLFFNAPAAIRSLDRIAAQHRIDLVCSSTLAVLGGALWARARGVPHVWHVHEMIERPVFMATIFASLLRLFADVVICNSNATRDFYARRMAGLTSRCQVVWNGVPDPRERTVEEQELRATRARFRPHGESVCIGLVGRINSTKGHALLLAAAERLHASIDVDFSLVFIGGAPRGQDHHVTHLRERIAGSPIRDRVVLCDFIADTRAAYAALDVVCIPSTGAEAFGLVAVEAMAAGRVVVAARIGGLPEVVIDWQSGRLHTAGNAESLALALRDVVNHAMRRESLGQFGRRRYETEFTVRRMTDSVLDVMARMLVGKPLSPVEALRSS